MMMPSFEVVEGSKSEELGELQRYRENLMRLGVAGLTIYLNGGSETRRASREYWAEYARSRNIGFSSRGGCVVVIGGKPE